ncbi:phosphopantetheine-binding protein [Flexivirga caeni]|uniref:Isochorismatase n=1 Tax=Flexivirga caeni TaxID=2294115 RepID=A0A3M9M350_9MICO|nr:phosphopantetheine-binding protein [Flexivirga caeni]RNI19627.1 isochorismatase [Flexivirga caeni]
MVSLKAADVRATIAALIDVPIDRISDQENLIEHGIDSFRVIQLAERWSKLTGHVVRFADLAAEPTLAAWSRIVGVTADASSA